MRTLHEKPNPPREIVPFWDTERRELRLGKVLLKCIRQRAKNQETILASFEELGWPPHIDDPLPGGDTVDAVERLHEAVKKLNNQKVHSIHFLSDGSVLVHAASPSH